MPERPPIPLPMKRRIRQRCSFGCVICGSPVYDYEHMTEFSISGVHIESEITLLCTDHHREKTAGRLPVSRVRRANDAPFNSRRSHGKWHDLYFEGDEFFLRLGDVTFHWDRWVREGTAITVDGDAIFKVSFVDSLLELGLDLRDQDNRVLVQARQGVLRHAADGWDVTFEGTKITVRTSHGKIAFLMDLRPPNEIAVLYADTWMNGVNIRIGNSAKGTSGLEIVNSNVSLSGCTLQGASPAIEIAPQLGSNSPLAMLTLASPKRFHGGSVPPTGSFYQP